MTPKQYITKNKKAFLDAWFEALRIPSVSALAEHKSDMKKMADWLEARLGKLCGFKARQIPTKGNPLVYAESPKVAGKPTVLIYGHYDVQPVDPLGQWKSPPFEPTIRNGFVFCRGADDDKGQSLAHLFGVETLLATGEKLPVQVKFLFEGEEEIGSASLEKFLSDAKNRSLLAADVILVSDTDMAAPNTPAITCGLRGIIGCEIELAGPNRDLHSGLYGGSVMNPAIGLCKMLGSLMDENGHVQITGFYDDVVTLTDRDRAAFAERPFDESESYTALGLKSAFGEPEFTILERRGARPTFDINGLTSGYQGKGGKTIIPARASAKLTFRMVPRQKPAVILRSLKAFLKQRLPAGLTMKITGSQMASGFVVPLDSPFVQAASRGLKKTFGKKPLYVRDGGSIPVITALSEQLGSDLVLAGLGVEEDAIHSPNERYALDAFYKGVEASVAMITEIGKL